MNLILSVILAGVTPAALPQVMVVGVEHLVAKADLHNATWKHSAFAPDMQSQIAAVIQSIARFKPTKVMIEARATDPVYVDRYRRYLAGNYALERERG